MRFCFPRLKANMGGISVLLISGGDIRIGIVSVWEENARRLNKLPNGVGQCSRTLQRSFFTPA